jgi:SAM-dependent methyltransferase
MGAPANDELRTNLHRMWGSVADGWAAHADDVDARSAALTAAMIRATEPRAGDRVLELACGPGGTGLAAAPLVEPGGEVVLSDVAPEMVTIAAARAGALGRTNVRTRTLDLEAIAEPDAAFDVVLCREGLMFATDPAHALFEMRRVLRPGGRVALAVWGPQARNPWLGILLDSLSEQVGMPVPPPGIPGPFSLSDADRLRALLHDADLADVGVREIELVQSAPSFAEWWDRTVALAGPVSMILGGMPAEGVQAIRARADAAAQAYTSASGLDFPAVSLLATARRP